MEQPVKHLRQRKEHKNSKEVRLLKMRKDILHDAVISHIENILNITNTMFLEVKNYDMFKAQLKLLIEKHAAMKKCIKELNRTITELRKHLDRYELTVIKTSNLISVSTIINNIVKAYLSYARDIKDFDMQANKNTTEHLYKLINTEMFAANFLNKLK